MAGWAAASGPGRAPSWRRSSHRSAARDSPFDDEVPRVDARGTHWVEPVVVVDVDTHGTARNQRLRQPSYQGVRSDLTPEDLS